jgi:hypothetical protein
MRRLLPVQITAFLLLFNAFSNQAYGLTKLEGLRLFDRIAAKLDLNPEQRSEIFFLLARNQKEMRQLLAEEDSAQLALREAIAQTQLDEALVRDRSCRVAEAELALSLAAARLYAEVSVKLDSRQREAVRAWAAAAPVKDSFVTAATELARGSDLYLTVR